jgi:ferredoxin-fold anticodon binding domain-containing protein
MGHKSQEAVAVKKVPELLAENELLKIEIEKLKQRPQVSLEELSILYHDEATKELVVHNAKNLITKLQDQKPFMEWKDLSEDMKEGRRIMMKILQQHFLILRRD